MRTHSPMRPPRSLPLRAIVSALLLGAALAACTSVRLDPWPAPRPVPVASPPPAPVSVVPPQRAASPAGAEPVPPAASASAPPAASAGAAAASSPYGPAVAARFPDPPVDYRTPAFAPGHAGFTSNAELHAFLVDRVREASAKPGGADVRLLALGTSQLGTPLEALLFARAAGGVGAGTPRNAVGGLVPGRPTIVLVGQQHGDEPASSEALLAIALELAQGRLEPLLDRINVVVYPRANPDGAEAGTRTTVNGIDANRDHLLLRTPEAQAQAILVREFAPVVVVDAHEYLVGGRYLEKFNAVQRFDALLQYATTANVPTFVTRAAEEWFREPTMAALRDEGLSVEWYYTTTNDIADRKVSMGGTQADTGRNVNGLTNAISLLVETRGVGLGRLHFKRRVHTHVIAVASILRSAAARQADLVKLRQYVDQEVGRQACQGELVVEAAPTPSEYRLLMLDPITGADKPVTVAWDSALQLRPLKVRPRPCGYWLSARQGPVVERLRALGVRVLRLEEDGELRGETYRELVRDPAPRVDGRAAAGAADDIVRARVQLVSTLLDVKAGSYYVPLDQPLANLAAVALEPDTENSFFAHRVLESIDDEARVMAPPVLRTTPLPEL